MVHRVGPGEWMVNLVCEAGRAHTARVLRTRASQDAGRKALDTLVLLDQSPASRFEKSYSNTV